MEDQKQNPKVSITQLAVKKACLHSLKYLTDDTLGILVGVIDKNQIIIEDAYPLFHSRITEPTLQIAFDMIQGIIPNELKIIGIYESIIRLEDDKDLQSQIGTKILETISEMNSINPIFIKIEEPEVPEQEEEVEVNNVDHEKIDFQIYQVMRKSTSEFNLKLMNSCLEEPISLDSVYSEFKKGTHRLIIDFDNHFEDSSLDFTNPQVQL